MLTLLSGNGSLLDPQVEADFGALVDVDVHESRNAGLGRSEVQLMQRLRLLAPHLGELREPAGIP